MMTMHRTGLTLVEVTVALAIAGLVTMAVMTATTGMLRAQRAGERRGDPALAQRLEDLLAMDLGGAARYRNTPAGLEILTTHSLDPQTLHVRHLDATVTYERRNLDGKIWLVRSQQCALEGMNSRELVATGIARIAIGETSPDEAAKTGHWKPLGAATKVTIVFDDPETSPLEVTIRQP